MCRSDLKHSPACSSLNSEQDRVLLLYPAAIFSIRSAPKYNDITLAGRHRRNGQNSNWSNDGDWPRGWGRSGLETFLGTMNHRFRFSTSGNPTKHMPIGYLSLWVQPRSVTSGDLSWPWPSSGTMSRVTSSHVLTPISSTIPIQVNRTTPSCVYDFAEILRRLFLLWRHNFVTWPDPTKFFSPKVAQRMPHKLWKISARSSERCGVQLRKTHGGVASTPPDRARVKKCSRVGTEYQQLQGWSTGEPGHIHYMP